MGPSFSYIGFVSYQVARIITPDDINAIRTTIYYGYIFAGIILLILSWIYRYKWVKKFISTIFPSTIMGPAISLIGLELANMASEDSGFAGENRSYKILAVATLLCIIIFSLLKHHFLQNASILIGVFLGCIIATIMGVAVWPEITELKISLPRFYFSSLLYPPKHWISLVLAIFPCTMIAFVESLGRLAVYKGMLKRDERPMTIKTLTNAITQHSMISTLTSVTSMMPSAIYAENMAIMNLHSAELSTKYGVNEEEDIVITNCYSTYSIYPYVIASVISIAVALINGLQDIFIAIPMPILGGMELFVFGLIAAPGIQMLVEQQVNYKKISNQIITASVLLAGISDITISYGTFTLKGMSLGLTIGVIVNCITLVLGYWGYLNEKFALNEILDECVNVFDNATICLNAYKNDVSPLEKEISSSEFKKYIRQNEIRQFLNSSYKITLCDIITKKNITLLQESGRINIRVELGRKYSNKLFNDYPRITGFDKSNRMVTIIIDEHVSKRILIDILKNAV